MSDGINRFARTLNASSAAFIALIALIALTCTYCVYRGELVRESPAIVSNFNEVRRNNSVTGRYGSYQAQVI
jgi:hypothetical protein